MTISKKLGVILIISVVLILLSTFISRLYNQKIDLISNKTRTESVVFVLKAKEMQINIIQVQQWLTDISATRAAEGFDDGYKEAQNQADLFIENYRQFHKLFTERMDKHGLDSLEELRKKFDAFYATGKKLAATYVSEGPAGGNAMMGEFDAVAGQLTELMESLVAIETKELNDNMEAISTNVGRAQFVSITINVIIILVIMVTTLFISRDIRKNVAAVLTFVSSMAAGNLTTKLHVATQDEFGEIAAQLTVMHEHLRSILQGLVTSNKEIHSSANEVSKIAKQVATNARETLETSNEVAQKAESMSGTMNSVAAATEQAATNISMVAAASEEMTATINEIARSTEKTRDISEQAVVKTKSASDKLDSLGLAASEIGKVTEAITEISEQTQQCPVRKLHVFF